MDQNLMRTDLLPLTVGTGVLTVLAVLGVAAWVALHLVLRRRFANRLDVLRRGLLALFPGTVAVWLVLQLLARLAFLATPWPLLLGAFLGAAALEGISAFYLHEASRVAPSIARCLVACRMTAAALALFVLMQPVIVADRDREVRERVIVLVDDSASMHFDDNLLTDAEKADLTAALGIRAFPEKGMTRAEMIDRLVNREGGDPFLKAIAEKYRVDVFRFGNGLRRHDLADPPSREAVGAREKAFRSVTDLAQALERAVREVPAEEVSSILVFTDGRHNGETGVDSIARRLGSYGIHASFVIVGGSTRPFDIAIASAEAPDSVFLGDKIRFTVTVKATGANGRQSKIRFVNGKGDVMEEQPFTVEGDVWTKEFRFSDRPESQSVYRYGFEVKPFAGELFAENNARSLAVAVSDDRTNVLLVDGRPRWEYRYLRNLFYGRDKSVHLQDWIVHPDSVFGLQTEPRPFASASRAFGDSEAGGWPLQDGDWLPFDVIIVGDIGSDVLTDEVVEHLRRNVEERGSLLVLIAGPEFMPMSHVNPKFRDLLPVDVDPDGESHRVPPEDAFEFRLTAQGRGHPVMRQSASPAENEEIWQTLPDFHWRLPVRGIKPGAEVLATARPRLGQAASEATAASLAAEIEEDPDSAIRKLEEMREAEARNALIVAQARGRGRVLMLLTDDLWRLRSKEGDARHHMFWGQVMRWGAGEKLRTGNNAVRLGTDQLRYAAGESVRLFARVRDGQYDGLDGLSPRFLVYPPESSRGKAYDAVQRPDANGFYECEVTGCTEPGEYRVIFDCPAAKKRLGVLMPSPLETNFEIVTAKRPVEEVEITATREVVARIASATHGRVMTPSEYAKLTDDTADGSKTLSDRIEYPLWSMPPLFLLVVLLLTGEWILRKRATLS